MASLAKLLAAKLKAAGLNVTAGAKKVGVTFPSFRNTLSGKSAPNARSVGKYAAFLGIDTGAVMAASGKKPKAAKPSKGKPGRRGRPPGSKSKGKMGKKAKKPGRRGRPPGSKNKVTGKNKKPGRRGRPPGSGKAAGTAAKNGKAVAALAKSLKAVAASLKLAVKIARKLK